MPCLIDNSVLQMHEPIVNFLSEPQNNATYTALEAHCEECHPYDLLHRLFASLTPTGMLPIVCIQTSLNLVSWQSLRRLEVQRISCCICCSSRVS